MRPITASRYLGIFAAAALFLIALATSVNWAVDPLQFYRKASYPPEFVDQSRYQNPGLARNYPYDAVIAGTSVSLGFSRQLVRQRLGWNSIDLAMSGASAHEQSLLLNIALRTGRVQNAFWDLNFEYLRGDPNWVSDYDGAFPGYLYDDDPWRAIPFYLLNVDTCKASLRVLLERCGARPHQNRSLDDLSRLEPTRPAGRLSVLAAFKSAHGTPSVFQRQPDAFSLAKLDASFESNYCRIIRAHPEVGFDLWFPPFSIARHAFLSETAPVVWNQMFQWKRDVLSAVSSLPNVRLHDFQGDENVVLDLDRFSDTVHFDATVRERIVVAVAARTALADAASLSAAETMLRREAAMFCRDPARFGNSVRTP